MTRFGVAKTSGTSGWSFLPASQHGLGFTDKPAEAQWFRQYEHALAAMQQIHDGQSRCFVVMDTGRFFFEVEKLDPRTLVRD